MPYAILTRHRSLYSHYRVLVECHIPDPSIDVSKIRKLRSETYSMQDELEIEIDAPRGFIKEMCNSGRGYSCTPALVSEESEVLFFPNALSRPLRVVSWFVS